jgi:hypothetical protein
VHAEQSRGRGVRALGNADAGDPVRDEVGDEQGGLGLGRAVIRGELVQRGERQELQAVAGVQLGERHSCVHHVDAAGAAFVAVVERLGPQRVALQQPVVDRPGVDADALDRGLAAHRLGEAVEDVLHERLEVPVQAVLAPHGPVREPCHLLEFEQIRSDAADHDAPARGAEIDGGERATGLRGAHRADSCAERTGSCRVHGVFA